MQAAMKLRVQSCSIVKAPPSLPEGEELKLLLFIKFYHTFMRLFFSHRKKVKPIFERRN